MKIVLASQSPRRKELLGRMGLEFVTQASKIDESAFDGLEARELVATLSREKAQWIARQLDGETLVIGADTVVVRDGAALGKPKDAEDAVAMLLSLSGRDHPGLHRRDRLPGGPGPDPGGGDPGDLPGADGGGGPPVRLHRGADGQGRGLWHPGSGRAAGGGHPGGLQQCGRPAGVPSGADAEGLWRGLSGAGRR